MADSWAADMTACQLTPHCKTTFQALQIDTDAEQCLLTRSKITLPSDDKTGAITECDDANQIRKSMEASDLRSRHVCMEALHDSKWPRQIKVNYDTYHDITCICYDSIANYTALAQAKVRNLMCRAMRTLRDSQSKSISLLLWLSRNAGISLPGHVQCNLQYQSSCTLLCILYCRAHPVHGSRHVVAVPP